MVLAQPELRAEVDNGRIEFDPPLEEVQWGQASVDLRLGFSFTKLKRLPGVKLSAAQGFRHLAAAGFWDTMELAERDQLGNRQAFPLDWLAEVHGPLTPEIFSDRHSAP